MKVSSMDAGCRACTGRHADIRRPDVYEEKSFTNEMSEAISEYTSRIARAAKQRSNPYFHNTLAAAY